MDVTNIVITTCGGLMLFLFGMKIMSEGLQKVAGPKMRKVLSVMTANRFAGVGTGMFVTSAIQSSSATTVMLVGFVSAGLITLTESIGVVMGSNIGTTMTTWIVALLGFQNFKITALAFPAIVIGFLPRLLGARRLADVTEFLLGFGILFLGLDFMKDAVHSLRDSDVVNQFMASATANGFLTRLGAVGIGCIVTMIIQSSSATMVITMTMAAQGLIDIPTAFALALGQNIGTTITANLAALGANTTAKQTARAHFLFNSFGALLAIAFFTPFLHFINLITPGSVFDSTGLSEETIAFQVAVFHTVFNVLNTALLLPFVSQLAWLSKKMVFGKDKKDVALKFLETHVVEATPMAIHAAKMEFKRMLEEVETMLGRVLMLTASPEKKMGKIADAIHGSEQMVDYLEKEIIEYLAHIAQLETSENQSHEITGLIGAVSDVERMGDHCEALSRLLAKQYDKELEISEGAIKELIEMGESVKTFIGLLKENIDELSETLMPKANQMEEGINDMRKRMRNRHIKRLNDGDCTVVSGLIFIDMLTSFEKMGDHAYNVAQMLAGER